MTNLRSPEWIRLVIYNHWWVWDPQEWSVGLYALLNSKKVERCLPFYILLHLISILIYIFLNLSLISFADSCVCEGITIQGWHFKQTDHGFYPINFAFLPLLNTQSTKGEMSVKQTRSHHVADNYRQAPQKCQYVKVGAVCEKNGDKWQSLRSIVVTAAVEGAFPRLSAYNIRRSSDKQHAGKKVERKESNNIIQCPVL